MKVACGQQDYSCEWEEPSRIMSAPDQESALSSLQLAPSEEDDNDEFSSEDWFFNPNQSVKRQTRQTYAGDVMKNPKHAKTSQEKGTSTMIEVKRTHSDNDDDAQFVCACM